MEEIEKKNLSNNQRRFHKKRWFVRKNQITTTHTDGHSASVIPSQAAVL